MYRFYEWTLGGVLKHRHGDGHAVLRHAGGHVLPVHESSHGTGPNDDYVQMKIDESAQGTSFYKLVEYQRAVAEVVRKEPNIETFMTQVGGGTTAAARALLQVC